MAWSRWNVPWICDPSDREEELEHRGVEFTIWRNGIRQWMCNVEHREFMCRSRAQAVLAGRDVIDEVLDKEEAECMA